VARLTQAAAENFDDRNVFLYDAFGGPRSRRPNDNRFELCSLWNPGGECTQVRSANNTFFKSHFACKKAVDTCSC
jgi:hypothetical protein